jgi:hypothetical protein
MYNVDFKQTDPRYNVEYERHVFSTLTTQISRYVNPRKR